MASRWANSRFRNARHDRGRWGPRRGLWDSSAEEAAFTPSSLGTDLYEGWDANDTALITESSGSVSAWTGNKLGVTISQATEAFKPVYNATSFNGAPGIAFDGSDDFLAHLSTTGLPTGTTAFEIWALVQQDALVADTTSRTCVGYGASSAGSACQIRRRVSGGQNQVVFLTSGTGTVETTTSFSSRHAIRALAQNALRVEIDGTASTPGSATHNLGDTRLRFGATAVTTAAEFWEGQIAGIWITKLLDSTQAALMLAYLTARI